MNPHDLSNAKDPLILGSLAAMKRAAEMARKIAIQTNTGIVIMRDGKIVRLSADDLRREDEAHLPESD